MPRDIPIGNGNLLVAFNKNYLLQDFYFPHVGDENHTAGKAFKFGVWVNGNFSWLSNSNWQITMNYLPDTLATNVTLTNQQLGITIDINDLVHFQENIFLKKIKIKNLSTETKDIRLFFCHDFNIYGHNIGDTAVFRPETNALLHYKNERYFLINLYVNKKYGVDYFATGNKNYDNDTTGTWKDAEDGILSANPISQGSVDSVVAMHLKLEPEGEESCFYWICAGKNWQEVKELNDLILRKTPETIFQQTVNYWHLWVNKENLNYALLSDKISWLYKKSLLITRTQINNNGSIIAANDSDTIQFNRDTYSYMWTRDAALIAYALDLAGYFEISQNFFALSAEIIEKDGYFLHKYNPSGSVASSWVPWIKDKKTQLPIQEDETALVIWALWQHYSKYKDIEFIKSLYENLIKNAANFMMDYLDNKTGLPLPSYDLWEERRGILTYTAATVYGGLTAAANFAEIFGEINTAQEYRDGAAAIRNAMDKYLYLAEEKRFARMINFGNDGKIKIDATIDSSICGIFLFGAYNTDDEKVQNTMQQIYNKLWCKKTIGGLGRYENDPFYRISNESPSNPWFVTTLWLAQYYIAIAKSKEDLEKAMVIINWVVDHALPSGVLAEQVNPHTNEPLSVAPLTWSHATFIAVVNEYLDKFIAIEKCPACNMPKYSKTK